MGDNQGKKRKSTAQWNETTQANKRKKQESLKQVAVTESGDIVLVGCITLAST